MMPKIQPIILCGGAGSRLWPESRGQRAKQFLTLTGSQSLLQQTIRRTHGDPFAAPLILCGRDHVTPLETQLDGHDYQLLVEPMARGTAAAIALAAAYYLPSPDGEDQGERSAAPLLLVMPSDHVISDIPAFHHAIAQAAPLAEQGWIVTFGITPDAPETGFGYIAAGDPLSDGAFAVTRFIEKPPREAAEAMLSEGGYSWNAGIFLFRADCMADAMGEYCPDIWAAASQSLAAAPVRQPRTEADAAAFAAAPNTSIDYAVMEHHPRVAVVPVSMGWSDIGSWAAVHSLAEKDSAQNAISGDAWLHGAQGNLVRAGGKRISLIGVEGLAVIVDGDDILILPLDQSQDVRLAAQQEDQRSNAPSATPA